MKKFFSTLLMFLALVTGLSTTEARADSPSEEYLIKAAFLFRFAQFVDWPPEVLSEDGPIRFCTLGQDPFKGALETTLSGKKIAKHSLEGVHLKPGQDLRGCNLIFIGSDLGSRAGSVLSELQEMPVVTISDTERFTQRGGVIGFCWEGMKIRFDINVTAAEKAHLRISARLLSLARTVIGGGGKSG